ncbi:hypothetical protein HK405_002492, partial [Cladochytrium tenue]
HENHARRRPRRLMAPRCPCRMRRAPRSRRSHAPRDRGGTRPQGRRPAGLLRAPGPTGPSCTGRPARRRGGAIVAAGVVVTVGTTPLPSQVPSDAQPQGGLAGSRGQQAHQGAAQNRPRRTHDREIHGRAAEADQVQCRREEPAPTPPEAAGAREGGAGWRARRRACTEDDGQGEEQADAGRKAGRQD